ncbi:MAG: hypothetical protein HC896_01945 [Bacteroidales bacterium]|nr:hypothetical protein [Bacteroidales bacterium]
MGQLNLTEYIQQPEKLNLFTLNQLKSLVDRYPYFQAARVLYTRNLKNLGHHNYQQQLALTATMVGDRKALYHFLHKSTAETENVAVPEPQATEPKQVETALASRKK